LITMPFKKGPRSLSDLLLPMIFEFAQKSFPTQYLLPFYRFERIFQLTY
jgi:hypothetical protein